jgi:ubiquinone/menaquinone biosynthesis C-methylase UbiE
MKKITYDIEWSLESTHWWFCGRRRLLKFLLSFLNSQRDAPVLDVGCGVGSNLQLFESLGFKVIGIDSEYYSLSLAKGCISSTFLVNGDLTALPFKANSVGLIIATDILEHLDEDTIGIKEIYRTLKNEGKVMMTVPAFKFLWGVQDIAGVHKRRYSKNELLKKIEQVGFKVLRSSYFNFFLFFPIFFSRRLIQILGLKLKSENEINFPLLNFLLKTIFSIEPFILKYCSFPLGVSIFCVAKKK